MRYACEWFTYIDGYGNEWQTAEELSALTLQEIIDALPSDTWLHVRSNPKGWLWNADKPTHLRDPQYRL